MGRIEVKVDRGDDDEIFIKNFENKTYFWVHVVRYYRMSYKQYIETTNDKDIVYNFDGFLNFCDQKRKKSLKCKIMNEEWWNDFYSKNVMDNKGFNGIDASKQMVFPDIKKLPQLPRV